MTTEQQTPVAVNEEVAKVNEEEVAPVDQPAEKQTPLVEKLSEESNGDEPAQEASETISPEADTVEPTDDKTETEENSESKVDEKVADDVKVVEPEESAVESNGKHHSEPAAENGNSESNGNGEAEVETNGVCKRKAENGSATEAGDKTESSPKKVKVVSDDGQVPTEETAA